MFRIPRVPAVSLMAALLLAACGSDEPGTAGPDAGTTAAADGHDGHDGHDEHQRGTAHPNGVDADVIDLGLEDDGEMEVPSDFDRDARSYRDNIIVYAERTDL